MSLRRTAASFLVLLPLLAACRGADAKAPRGGPASSLAVRRSVFRQRLLLTGELAAQRAVELTVPRTPSWQLQIRWMERDGTAVAAGQRLVEFDNSQFTSDLGEKKLTAAQAESDLVRQTAEAAVAVSEKAFTVEQKRADLDKARIQAAVPAELLTGREHQDRQLAFRRAEVELAKALADLAAERQGSAADLAAHRIDLEKSRREIATAETAIGALVLKAPRAGMALVADHPWEGRKLREGDNVWVGLPVMRLPDLSSIAIDAALSDVDDGRVRPGMPALCTLDAFPGESFTARVVEVSPVARESARSSLLRSFKVRLAVDPVAPAHMRPGMSVKVEVLGPEARGVLLAPRAGLDLGVDPPRALLAAGGSTPVRLGACGDADCVVENGLVEGTRLRPALAGTAG